MQVLLPVDASDASTHAVASLRAFAKGRSGTVIPVLLNVDQPPTRTLTESEAESMERSKAERALAESLLARHQRTLSDVGFSVRSLVRSGATAATILDVAQVGGASLLVMGTRGTGMLRGFALGSVALRVVLAAPCPVILVKPDARLPLETREVTRVVVPVDGSVVADTAVHHILALRELFGPLHVELVHFEPSLTLIEAIMPPHEDVLRKWCGGQSHQAVAAARRLLDDAAVSRRSWTRRQILTNDWARALAAWAREQPAPARRRRRRARHARQCRRLGWKLGLVSVPTADAPTIPAQGKPACHCSPAMAQVSNASAALRRGWIASEHDAPYTGFALAG